MTFEDYLFDRMERNRGKENLYQRAYDIVEKHANKEIFKKNLRAVYLSIVSSKKSSSILQLPLEKIKDFKGKVSKKYNITFLDHLRDNNQDPTDEYWESMDKQEADMEKFEEWFNNFHHYNSYERSLSFRQNPDKEHNFQEKIKGYNTESFIFNRLYEMMITQLIQAHITEELPNYTTKTYKTNTYDDTMSGVDMIVAIQNKQGRRENIGIDHICGTSKRSIEEKQNTSNQSYCMDYNSSVRNGRYSPIKRIVWNTNPGISFLLFDWYLQKIARGENISPTDLAQIYYEIQKSHPELYQESLDNGTEIDNSSTRVKEELQDILF